MTKLITLWQEHKTHLRRFIARRVPDHNAVDDILQDVFLKAGRGLQAVKSQGSVAAWLYRIAANTIADHYRTQTPWEELPEDDQLAAPEPVRDPVAELATCLLPFITELPESYRQALLLSEIEGLPQQEVAHRLGLSLSGAKSRVQRGREKLRQRLLVCCDIEIEQGDIVGYERRDKTKRCSSDCGG